MGNRRYIPYNSNGEAFYLQRAQGGFSAHTWALNPHLRHPHTLIHCLPEGVTPGKLSGERGALSRALDTTPSSAGLGDHIPIGVGNSDNGVVKGGLDMDNSGGHIPLFPLAPAPLSRRSCHFRFPLITISSSSTSQICGGPFLSLHWCWFSVPSPADLSCASVHDTRRDPSIS